MNLTPQMVAFCTNPEKVKEMRQLLERPIMHEARRIMAEDSPTVLISIPQEITPHYAHILLGIGRGYMRYHNLFEYFGQHYVVDPSGESAAIQLEPEI